jgi:hypothetical protein
MRLRTIVRSMAAGLATSLALGATKWAAPQNRLVGAVCDALALPGALALIPLFPSGPHSGGGVALWGFMVLAVNLVVYSLAWFIVLLIRDAIVRRRVP